MNKKRFVWLSLFLMVLALTFGKKDVQAAEFVCGLTEDNITWSLYDDGTLVINGTGKVEEKRQYNVHKSQIKKIVIGEGITDIEGFSDYTALEEVELPSTLEGIGHSAFIRCSSLKEVELPETVKYIGISAFLGCTSLEKINFPDSLNILWHYAFSGCTSLKSAILPYSLSDVPSGIFHGCTSLEKVRLPRKISKIKDDTFGGCISLKDVEMPLELYEISDNAFFGCQSLQEIVIPASVEYFGNNCFRNCYSLSNIEMSDKLFSSLTDKAKKQSFANTKWYVEQTTPFIGKIDECTYVINADCSMTVTGGDDFKFYQLDWGYSEIINTLIIGPNIKSVSLNYGTENLEKIINKSDALIRLWTPKGYSWCDINDQSCKIKELGKGTAIRVEGDLPEKTEGGSQSGSSESGSQSGNSGNGSQSGNAGNGDQAASEKVNIQQAEETGLKPNAKAKISGGITVQASADGSSVRIISAENKKKLTIPATVKVEGKEYPVTEIAKKAVTGKKVAQLTVDARNLTKVHKDAFKGANKLSKMTVKKAKKGTKIAKQLEKALKRANKKAKISYKK
ncbi:leucine-rich repeat protein [Butyrivibrio sp. WCD3002]|uniref:leucine-rich repeat protein n=1 Tax=Butyrivibrio sp. WCD3002 TaxID=1280676 RepID=UPI000418FE6D|nr:leucine-rich repeat protein [Butyrivibrio sp. WCD3002]